MRRFAIALAALATAACGDKLVLVQPYPVDAASYVTTFDHLADSVARSNGDTALGRSYTQLADALRRTGRITPVTIGIDGVATPFVATAVLSEVVLVDSSAHKFTMRNLLAFNAGNPKEIIQLTSAADSEPIRAYIYPTFAPFAGPSASLVYQDGKGGSFFGTSGSHSITATPSAVRCTTITSGPLCTNTDFSVAFSAKAEASQFLAHNNTATGSHAITMPSQTVLGVTVQSTLQIPVVVTPSAPLPARLTATIDSVVNIAFTVSNPTSAPVTLSFASGQQFDVTIADATTGQALWTWSATRLFIAAQTAQTIAANGSITFNAAWKPTRKGALVATSTLTSTSHRATASAGIVVP